VKPSKTVRLIAVVKLGCQVVVVKNFDMLSIMRPKHKKAPSVRTAQIRCGMCGKPETSGLSYCPWLM
jgi:hypothetical protein